MDSFTWLLEKVGIVVSEPSNIPVAPLLNEKDIPFPVAVPKLTRRFLGAATTKIDKVAYSQLLKDVRTFIASKKLLRKTSTRNTTLITDSHTASMFQIASGIAQKNLRPVQVPVQPRPLVRSDLDKNMDLIRARMAARRGNVEENFAC